MDPESTRQTVELRRRFAANGIGRAWAFGYAPMFSCISVAQYRCLEEALPKLALTYDAFQVQAGQLYINSVVRQRPAVRSSRVLRTVTVPFNSSALETLYQGILRHLHFLKEGFDKS
jgi:hypothetical protein